MVVILPTLSTKNTHNTLKVSHSCMEVFFHIHLLLFLNVTWPKNTHADTRSKLNFEYTNI